MALGVLGLDARGVHSATRPTTTGARAADRDADDRGQLVGPPDDQGGADDQAGDTCRDVDRRQGCPPALALEGAGLPAHDRDRDRAEADHGCRGHAVEAQGRVDRGREQQEQKTQPEGGAVGDPHDPALDLGDVLRLGGDPAGRGGLQGQRGHADHQQQVHQRGERAVLLRAEGACRDHRVRVRRHVHDGHGDGDGPALGDQPRRSGALLGHAGECVTGLVACCGD